MNKFYEWFKSYNDFSKSDRNAILILCCLILITIIAIVVVNHIPTKSKYNHAEYGQLLQEMEAPANDRRIFGKSLFHFDPNVVSDEILDSLDIPLFIKRNILNYRKAGGRFTSSQDIRKIYGMNDSIFSAIKDFIVISENKKTFVENINSTKEIKGFIDPNVADFSQMVNFGFNRFQSKNIIEYRAKGGVFKTKTDLLKIYGIDSVFFNSVENNILVSVPDETPFVKSNPVLLHVELNNSDTTELMKLNGIGAVYASRIIKYRNLLGGFYSTSQLLEVYNFPEETYKNIENNISVDTLLIKKIRLNFAEYVELLRHPYLKKDQVSAILKYRDKNGAFKEIIQLKTMGLIDSESFDKIRPYLTCR
jgi:DNA uptake protein ComE-like DNA-binding protein